MKLLLLTSLFFFFTTSALCLAEKEQENTFQLAEKARSQSSGFSSNIDDQNLRYLQFKNEFKTIELKSLNKKGTKAASGATAQIFGVAIIISDGLLAATFSGLSYAHSTSSRVAIWGAIVALGSFGVALVVVGSNTLDKERKLKTPRKRKTKKQKEIDRIIKFEGY